MKEIKIKVPDVAHIVISGPTQCGKSIVMDTIEKALKAKFGANVVSEDKLTIGFGNKGNVKVGGKALGQRFPVTLYAPSWLKVLDQADEIRQFIEDNKDQLTWER